MHVGLRRSFTAVQGDFDFLGAPRGVGQGLRDVLGFEVGILAENLFPRPTSGDETGRCRRSVAPLGSVQYRRTRSVPPTSQFGFPLRSAGPCYPDRLPFGPPATTSAEVPRRGQWFQSGLQCDQ